MCVMWPWWTCEFLIFQGPARLPEGRDKVSFAPWCSLGVEQRARYVSGRQ